MEEMSEELLRPATVEALAQELAAAAESGEPIETGGSFTKRRIGGPVAPAAVRISTSAVNQVLAYEPKDLTISVGAGMRWADLTELLANNGQALPLDPPFADATVGGALAADLSGPRRRRYGTARDLVIGMSFATVEGKVVQSGGMVVKNVTGLDMGKLMIGSMGTLGLIATANFKVFPRPEQSATFAFLSDSSEKLVKLRGGVLSGVAQPAALDLLNGPCGKGLSLDFGSDFVLLAEATGSEAVVRRTRAEYEALARKAAVEMMTLEPAAGEGLWRAVREFHPMALEACKQGLLLRISTTATNLGETLALLAGMAPESWVLSRAANAVVWCALPDAEAGASLLDRLRRADAKVLAESAPEGASIERWAASGSALEAMRRLKAELDPRNTLNRGRLWGKI
jgi:glycolate oxidase FAD binding subunit